MTTTESETDDVAEPVIDDATLDRLMAQVDRDGLELLGPDGVLTELTSRIMNRALEVEMTDHLGYEHGDPAGHGSGNNRNGTSPKNVLTDAGAIPVKVPRDRNGEFEPALVSKHARRIDGFNDIVLSLVSRGMTTRDVQAHPAAAYKVDVSPELISKITDAVLSELRAWQSRPLEVMYPILYLDAIVVKVRTDGRVTNRPVYIAMAVDLDGCKHVLGLWLGTGDEAELIAPKPSFALKLAKESVNQILGTQGYWASLRSAFGLHSLAHSHNREQFHLPIDPSGLRRPGGP